MIITREKGMRMWGGGSGSTSASGVNGGGGFSLAVTEGEGTGNAYTGFTYESGVLSLIKGENFVTVDFFNRLFTAYDSDGNAILPNDVTSTINNLKLLVGTWTEEYLSALGKNSEGGGGGGVDLTAVWASLTNTDSPTYSETLKININHIPNIGWSKIDNKPTTLAGYGITDAKIASGTITLGSNTITPLTANSSLSWSKLTGTPTTLAGYGIGDAKIAKGVITLGSSTITPVTSVAMTVPTGFSVTGSPITKTGTLALAYATGYEGFTTALKEKIEALYSWFEIDANGNVKTKDMPNGTHRGFYTESFVSALGSNSEGGGSGADLEDVWDSLTNQQGTVITDNTKIAIAHIPDTSSTYGYLKSSALNGYVNAISTSGSGNAVTSVTKSGNTITFTKGSTFLTSHQTLYTLSIYGGTTNVLDFKPDANASIYIKAGGDISLTNDTTNKYITLSYTHPTNGANTTISAASGKVLSAITVNSLGHVTSVSSKTLASADIPDISATYATASRATTLEGYFNSGGVAKVAAKLNTGTTTYTAWGQTYWSSGVPQSISGNMTSVGSITPSANGNALGTTSARFNIYGTAGNFSGNVSISGTLGVTGATTLSSTLSVAGGITLTTTKKIYFGDTSHYLELDSTGFHFSHGVYSDSFVSALGSNSSGGGSGTFDEDSMWAALGTTSTAKVIASSHIPNLAASKITSGTLASARIPVATASAVGGIKVGTTLAISDGVLNQKSGIATAGTYRSVTVDTYGRVTSGTNPTTLSGYGITNAYTKTQVDNALSGYLVRKTYNISGKSAVRITFNNVNGGIISARVTKQSGSLVLIGNGYGEGGTTRNNWVQISESTSYFSWCIPTASGIEKSVEIYNNDTTTASIVVASFDTDVTFTELSALSTTASTVKVAYASSLEDYLPLTGGTITGILEVNNIQSTSGNGLLAYHPSAWEGASNTQWGVGSVDSQGVIRSNNSNLLHYKGGTSYTILDSSNYSSYALPLSGGEMTGPLTWKNATALSGVTSTNYVLCIDGFADGGTTHYITTANLSVGSATKATQDGDGRTITSTYLTDIDINSNNNLTQTKNGTASIVGNLLERNHTVRYSLSAAGWYRIGTFMNALSHGNVCFLFVRREYNSQNNESYIFAITTGYSGAITISQLAGQANVHQMTKIRVDYVNNTSTKPAIDIYMSTANQNNYAFTIIGSAQLSNTATINPTLIGSQYEYSTVSGMGTSRNFTAVGEVTASSDARLKTIVGDATLSLKDIANAPNVLFRWNDGRDDKVHGGSIAQYWLQKASQFVCGEESGFYSLNYGALATSMAISIAKEVVKHDDEITRLKKEVVKQAEEIVELKNKVRELEERRVA